jgi:hypothetical protein
MEMTILQSLKHQGITDARTQHHAHQQTLGSDSDVPNWTKSLYSSSLPIHSDCLNGCLKPLLHAYSRKLQLMLIGSGYQPQLPAECYTTWWGACSVATQCNSPRHSQSINQSIVYLSQIIQEAVSASTRCFTVCSLYIQFYKRCYLTTNPSVYQTDWLASISNGQTVQLFPLFVDPFCPNGKPLSCTGHLNSTVFWPQQEPGV